jgi:hypothetical protein
MHKITLLSSLLFLFACSDDPASVADEQLSSATVLSSTAEVSMSSSVAENTTPSSVSDLSSAGETNGADVTVYTIALGGQVATGGWWYGNAQKGDGTANSFSCGENVYDGLTEQPADWGAECETANGQEIGFQIEFGTDGQGYDWGYALVGFDFVENHTDTPDNMKEVYDLSSFAGVCVTYTSPVALSILLKTTDDMDGDAYGALGMPATEATEICKSWGELNKQSWSQDWVLNPANATGMQFKIEREGEHLLTISDVHLY